MTPHEIQAYNDKRLECYKARCRELGHHESTAAGWMAMNDDIDAETIAMLEKQLKEEKRRRKYYAHLFI
jgi:hypothetical protein